MTETTANNIDGLTFEAALAQLDTLIEKLEAGSIALDDAISAYERGTKLARHCEALLDRTERRVTALVVSGDGTTREAPLQVSADAPPEPAAPALFPREQIRPRAVQVDPDDVPF